MEPALEIKMVRDNLALAVSLWTAADKGVITPAHLLFESRWGVTTAHEVSGTMVRHTREELVRKVTNQLRSSFAFSVMQTHLSLSRVYPVGPLDETDPDLRAARCAVQLLNASMDQGLLTPVWACPPEYRRRFEARPISFVLDAASLDGTPVVWEQFGGLEKFLELLDYCAAWVKTWSGNNDVPDAPIDWASRTDSGFSPRVPPGPDPISGFVTNRCYVDPDAKVPASRLYRAYSEWSWEMGRQAKGQRSFGMGLTKMGFQRRRRGQGYHWWIGIGLHSEERTGV